MFKKIDFEKFTILIITTFLCLLFSWLFLAIIVIIAILIFSHFNQLHEKEKLLLETQQQPKN